MDITLHVKNGDNVLYGKVQGVTWSGRAGVAVFLEQSPATPAHRGRVEGWAG